MKRIKWPACLKLNNMKLRDKLLLMYFISVFAPIVLTNIIFYQVTTSHVRNQKERDASVALEQTKREFRSLIEEAVGISYLYYTDSALSERLDHRYESTLDYVEAYHTYLRHAFTRTNQAAIRWLQIYVDNPTIHTSGNIELLTDEVRSLEWFRVFSREKVPYPVLISADGTFSLLQRLDNYTNEYEKLLKIDLNMDMIRQLFLHSPFEGDLYLTGPDGVIQYARAPDAGLTRGRMTLASVPLSKDTMRFVKPYEGVNYLKGWTLHGFMDERIVLEEVRKSWPYVIGLASLNFLVPSLILILMARSIHVRLIRLLKHMKKVKNQNFETIPPAQESRDEIGQLIGEFNRMTGQIRSLIQDVYMADIQKKDLELKQRLAQLHALQSQINPHFLFNALETIRMRSLIKNEVETARIIRNMAKIFRKSISWGRDWVTIREELELVECFLEIQKYRFGNKLKYIIEAEDEAIDTLIPKMTLLPFVENASIHGIESIPHNGLIAVAIRLSGERLQVTITDNGIGMPRDKLEDILLYLNEDTAIKEKIGMKNAFTRLRMCYGEQFQFEIRSEPGQGTAVEIGLPMKPAV